MGAILYYHLIIVLKTDHPPVTTAPGTQPPWGYFYGWPDQPWQELQLLTRLYSNGLFGRSLLVNYI